MKLLAAYAFTLEIARQAVTSFSLYCAEHRDPFRICLRTDYDCH
jgi:hypothetical protein